MSRRRPVEPFALLLPLVLAPCVFSGRSAGRSAGGSAARGRTPWLAACAVLAVLAACRGGDDTAHHLAGTLERDRFELSADSEEEIVLLLVREGDVVVRGQPLVRLDPRRAETQLAAARAQGDRSAARLRELERGPRGERIAEARARQQGAEAARALARVELERVVALVHEGVLSQDAADRARATLEEAASRREQADALLLELERGTRSEELDQARAEAAATRARIDELALARERLELRAPQGGMIDALPFELGERAPRGAALVVLLRGGAPYARVFVPEPMRARVAVGTPARVRVDGVAAELAGRVRFVSSEAAFTPYHALTEHDRGRLAYETEIELPDAAAARLPAGLPLQAQLVLAQPPP